MPTHPLHRLDPLLRSVSRSFYLSIRLLPVPLRAPVGLGYLLARATDTVADTASVPLTQRQALLALLGDAIGRAAVIGGGDSAAVCRFAQAQEDPHERALMLRLDECLAALHALPGDDRRDVQAVLRHIVRGQALDLARFPDALEVRALDDAASLHDYTYLVAGCVGEFWTDLCLRHLPGYAELPAARMRALGRSFGCGLQLVNIVRDVAQDLAGGRCYLPADELAAAGLAPARILGDPQRFLPVWARWQAAAAAGMVDGMAYALAVRERRPRAAAALPALLGARTLALLQAAGVQGLHHRVKVPRREVHAVLARTVLTLAGRRSLQSQFAQLSGGIHGGWDNPLR